MAQLPRRATHRVLKEVELPLIEIAGRHRRKSGEMRRPAGHQPQYPAQKITDLDIRVTRRRKLM